MVTDSDLLFLDAAIALAENGLYTTTPNPRVGCLLVREGRVIGRGWHQWAGGPHAEAAALSAATETVAGATCYVSLEPCAHQGRTPPCADALIAAAVSRVVIAARDPSQSPSIDRLRSAGILVDVVDRPAALALNRGFFHRLTQQRPLVRLKIAASLDGRTAMASGESQWITGAAARQDVQYWRARSCVVMTGIGTVLADDPKLNVRDARFAVDGVIRQPLRVVVDSTLRTPVDAAVLQMPGATLLATTISGSAAADIFVTPGPRVDLAAVLAELARRGANEVLVEAGAILTGELLRTNLWDEVIVYLAPKVLGKTARPFADLSFERLAQSLMGQLVDVEPIGGDVRIRVSRNH